MNSENQHPKNSLYLIRPLGLAGLLPCAVMLFFLFPLLWVNPTLFYVGAAIDLFLAAVLVIIYMIGRRRQYELLQEVAGCLSLSDRRALERFPMPVLVTDSNGVVFWQGGGFREAVTDRAPAVGLPLSSLFPEGLELEDGAGSLQTERGHFAVLHGENEGFGYYFFVEDTELWRTGIRYRDTRPAVAYIFIDNYEELLEDLKDSERALISSRTEEIIESLNLQGSGLLVRIRRDRFILILEEQYLREIIADGFSVMEKMRREAQVGDTSLTLSIGLGRGAENLFQGARMARQALDMALGRGGDQVVIKEGNNFQFFGGRALTPEKRTKVKTRIVAEALAALIKNASDVIVMGHKNADLDAIGSAVGLSRGVAALGKPVHIAVDPDQNLAKAAIAHIRRTDWGEKLFLSPRDAVELMREETLLVIVDTHSAALLESPELFRAAHTVVVIDHHRRVVGHIEDAAIFYHEPYASSASELVTELIQYFGEPKLGREAADVLLSGIMLDTKNFVVKTGVRTFEAAAFLRRQGADTVEARRFLSGTMDSYQVKSRLVSSALVYKRCAVAMTEEKHDEMQLIASQAADELLTIGGIDASFVLYEVDGVTRISARSLGAINVQTLMEQMGGGGHHTTAATESGERSILEMRDELMRQIDIAQSRPK